MTPSARVTVRYADAADSAPAVVVRSWRRGDIREMKMSTSSGPKDTMWNWVFMAFDGCKDAALVWLMVTRCTPFLLLQFENNRFADVTGREVLIARRRER
ncbi:MAG: hypothetical protein KGL39_11330 [Patescibacteria group bacterium]|nr:hypothetical protein [Patescibacteria group bacterium]